MDNSPIAHLIALRYEADYLLGRVIKLEKKVEDLETAMTALVSLLETLHRVLKPLEAQ